MGFTLELAFAQMQVQDTFLQGERVPVYGAQIGSNRSPSLSYKFTDLGLCLSGEHKVGKFSDTLGSRVVGDYPLQLPEISLFYNRFFFSFFFFIHFFFLYSFLYNISYYTIYFS